MRRIVLISMTIFIVSLVLGNTSLYFRGREASLENTFRQRRAVAEMAAAVMDERFNRLIDTGVSFATRVKFRQLVEAGKWEEAADILSSVPENFPHIERIFLTDKNGTLMADFPARPGVRGKNFAFRDWYQGVSREWKPYISNVYQRTAEPRLNVVALSIPIHKVGEERSLLGVLVMQIRLDQFLSWVQELKLGQVSRGYFVDVSGQVAGHVGLSPQAEILDLSGNPIVQKVLRYESGAELAYSEEAQETIIAAYAPVSSYGWGFIVEQSSRFALRQHNADTRNTIILQGLIALLCLSLMFMMFEIVRSQSYHRQREKAFLKSIGDGLVAIDNDWRITLWNPEATKLTGWEREEVIGKPFRKIIRLVREYDRTENVLFISDAMLTGEVRYMDENTLLLRKDGKEISVADSAAPIKHEDGTVLGAIIVFRDESAVRESRRLRSDFTYASHQLRTPVTKALWNLQILEDEVKDKQLKGMVAAAHGAVKSIAKLSEQLLITSQIDQEHLIPKKAEVKLVQLFQEVFASLKALTSMRNVRWNMPNISDLVSVHTDAKLLKRVLLEVVENAVRYNKPDGLVEIDVVEDKKNLRIMVRDTGIGIPEKEQSLIFTKFFRGSNFETTHTEGAGLGLYISKEIMKTLEGDIWFEENPEAGMVFWISLPKEPPQDQTAKN